MNPKAMVHSRMAAAFWLRPVMRREPNAMARTMRTTVKEALRRKRVCVRLVARDDGLVERLIIQVLTPLVVPRRSAR